MSITRNESISPTHLLYGLHYIILHSQWCYSFLFHAVGSLACLSIIQINGLFSLIYLGTRWSEQNSGNTIATNDVTHNSTCWLGLDGQYKQPFDTFHNPYPSIVKWWVISCHPSFCFRSKVFCDVTCCVILLADSSLTLLFCLILHGKNKYFIFI